jgi:hypothetical protein
MKKMAKRPKFGRFEFEDVISTEENETQELVKKLLDEINNFKPWEYCDQWETPSDFWSWMRGQLRSIWSKNWTPKNDYLNSSKLDVPKLDEDGNQIYYKSGKKKGQPVTYKAYKCELTGEIVKASKPKSSYKALYNTDHIEPAGSCRNGLEACIYLFRVLTSPDNMRILSTKAHKIITHMEKKGLTWEEAIVDKKAIAWCDDKFVDHKAFLKDKGFSDEEVSNAPKRKECYKKYLLSIGDTNLE